MDLSIVIPAFDEAKKVGCDIEAASRFLKNNQMQGEIIIVDDGSKDNTYQVAKSLVGCMPQGISLKVDRCEQHQGKGYAVRMGMSKATGTYAMFADSGCCVPYEDVLRGLELIKSGVCEIAHGSRKMSGCHIIKGQSIYRRLCSKFFHWIVVHDMKIPGVFTDTQCGFKIYKGDVARRLYSQCITDGFAFDIEIIMRAQRQGYRIKEFPINWVCDRDSRLHPGRTSWNVLKELLAIRRALSK